MIYEKELSDKLIDCAFNVYRYLGNGFLEKIYENALSYELKKEGIHSIKQHPIKVYYDQHLMGDFYADLFVENKIIVEIKVCDKIAAIHKAQLINYLKATEVKLGYLINFGNTEKLEFQRMVY